MPVAGERSPLVGVRASTSQLQGQPPEPIAIYRERLDVASEPFIAAQAEGLVRYRASYVGLRRATARTVPADRMFCWSDNRLHAGHRWLWKRHGIGLSHRLD